MIRFKEYVNIINEAIEWYHPSPAKAVYSYNHSSGHTLDVHVERSADDDPDHIVKFKINNKLSRSQSRDIPSKVKAELAIRAKAAIEHYANNKLPRGHTLSGHAVDNSPKDKQRKTSLYAAAFKHIEKKSNGGFTYNTEKSESGETWHGLYKEEYISEIYKPIAKDAVQWTTHSDLDHTVHIATHILPSGNKLNIAVGNYQGTREHSFGFDINSQYHKRKDLPKEDHVAIRNHVETAINHYIQHMMKKHDYLQGQAMGSNKTEQNKKDKLYKFALKSLAKKSKGKFAHEARPSIHGNADFHNLIKLSENVVFRLFRRTKNKIGNNLPNPIRQRIAAFPMLGASIRMKQDGHDKVAAKAREEGIKLLKGKGRIPPPGKRNRVDY